MAPMSRVPFWERPCPRCGASVEAIIEHTHEGLAPTPWRHLAPNVQAKLKALTSSMDLLPCGHTVLGDLRSNAEGFRDPIEETH